MYSYCSDPKVAEDLLVTGQQHLKAGIADVLDAAFGSPQLAVMAPPIADVRHNLLIPTLLYAPTPRVFMLIWHLSERG